MKRYTVVTFTPPGAIEVDVRNYEDVAFSRQWPSLCFACGQPTVSTDDRVQAARRDGLVFGEMLMRVGSQEFRRGLLEVLRV